MCSSLSMSSPSISQYNAIGAIQSGVVGCDDLRAGIEAAQDFELLTGTPADPDPGALSRLAVFRQNEDPVPAGTIQEGTDGEDARLRVAAQLQPSLRGLAGDQIRRTLAREIKVDGKLAVLDLW